MKFYVICKWKKKEALFWCLSVGFLSCRIMADLKVWLIPLHFVHSRDIFKALLKVISPAGSSVSVIFHYKYSLAHLCSYKKKKSSSAYWHEKSSWLTAMKLPLWSKLNKGEPLVKKKKAEKNSALFCDQIVFVSRYWGGKTEVPWDAETLQLSVHVDWYIYILQNIKPFYINMWGSLSVHAQYRSNEIP